MKQLILTTIGLATLSLTAALATDTNTSKEGEAPAEPKSVYGFTMKDIDGKDVKLADYKGKVCLIVNVASR